MYTVYIALLLITSYYSFLRGLWSQVFVSPPLPVAIAFDFYHALGSAFPQLGDFHSFLLTHALLILLTLLILLMALSATEEESKGICLLPA